MAEYVSNFTHTLEYRKGSTDGNADFISRLPLLRPTRIRPIRTELATLTQQESSWSELAVRSIAHCVPRLSAWVSSSWVGFALLCLPALFDPPAFAIGPPR